MRRCHEADAAATVDAAWDAGLRWFDTAPLYGHGLSEQRLGAALRAPAARRVRGGDARSAGVLVPGTDPDSIFAAAPALRPTHDYSARRGASRASPRAWSASGLERLDVLHVHDPDDHEAEALAGAFPRSWRAGATRARSARSAPGMNQSAMLARFVERDLVDCVLLAGRYSLLDQSGAARPAAAGGARAAWR